MQTVLYFEAGNVYRTSPRTMNNIVSVCQSGQMVNIIIWPSNNVSQTETAALYKIIIFVAIDFKSSMLVMWLE